MASSIVSIAALLISVLSLVISVVQKQKERDRNIRKSMSDGLENVSKINLEVSKLKQDQAFFNSSNGIELRRMYNSQRRILIAHVDFLVSRYDALAADIDCNLIAGGYEAIGDYEKANIFWIKTIEKSISNPIRHMNLRGYARFLFFQGKFQLGRDIYEEALKVELSDTDDNRRLVSDTYLMWASTEREFDNFSETERLLELGQSYCNRIGHVKMREELQKRFEQFRSNIKGYLPPSDIAS